MIIRSVDDTHDWTFGKGKQNYLYDVNAISLNIKTRLLSFLNDCFFDLNAGIDWFNLLGSKSQDFLTLAVKATILNSFGVFSISDLDIALDGQRLLEITYSVYTDSGVGISNSVEINFNA